MLLTSTFEYDADVDLHVTFVNPSKDIDFILNFFSLSAHSVPRSTVSIEGVQDAHLERS